LVDGVVGPGLVDGIVLGAGRRARLAPESVVGAVN
jgi:hypothetical protein